MTVDPSLPSAVSSYNISIEIWRALPCEVQIVNFDDCATVPGVFVCLLLCQLALCTRL